ncbi:Accumulation of dyads protein 2 [Psilocybe cubensis]|uniref:Gpr1 family protein n=2 Tax=Psilocybe cubensis TaxID=181762 RepID=A0A8H7XX83_PSICU|nr:Accumulation of dyads protein 2 [Psilocybe cubensis]KAH9482158.1 Accumulation of dyads protein 2 [Psilocybe cubensis]
MSTEKHDIEQVSMSNAPAPMMRPSRIANAGPAGIFSFASTTFMLSMYNVNTRGVHTPNVVVGMAAFTGGLLQFMAGMWEFPRGNVFGATAFSSYGCFWMSYALIFIPGSGILSAYSSPQELGNAIGVYLITWMMVTILFTIVVLRRNVSFVVLLSILSLAFALLAAGSFTGKANITKAGGIVGIIVALIAYYIGLSEMLEAERRPVMRLPRGVYD